MTHVASLKLSKELYELSGWNSTEFLYAAPPLTEQYRVVHRDKLHDLNDYVLHPELGAGMWNSTFAYDLGYLLRKLQTALHLFKGTGFEVAYSNFIWKRDPEDDLAKLAIELFKQGVLVRSES